MLEVERAIHRLTVGMATIPAGVDAGDFILSGGTLTEPRLSKVKSPFASYSSAVQEYTVNLEHMASSNRETNAGEAVG